MVCALAGRRIDDLSTSTPRFPLANIGAVRETLRATLVERGATALVASAANGADLVALEVAESLGLRRRIILPFERARFRRTSVVDRPGDLGAVFDRVVDEAAGRGDLVTIASNAGGDEAAYLAASEAILREAVRLADERHEPAAAIVVWEGRSRGAGDLTDAFRADAAARGLAVIEVSTLARFSQ
jgi:hypothetical protein